ncbi:Plus3 domain-containing protein [Citrus sinensis]|uniref:Plus3 domain-containing protein n=1 Tax=Citrus sinensis TaxID=2711 RepID=A0ACB8K847_CITSI|nr:Plus3 domain-containing protein [Citrus sinensis]
MFCHVIIRLTIVDHIVDNIDQASFWPSDVLFFDRIRQLWMPKVARIQEESFGSEALGLFLNQLFGFKVESFLKKMGRKKNFNKEKIAEDWCFVCYDGGSLILCDHKDCLKAYHPSCVNEDDSLLETGVKWKCDLHACYECGKAPKFYCLCSPKAICGHCICDAEFAIVKGNKGLCSGCLELVLLIEENKDVDSHGCKIDFSDPENSYFYEYWQIIKDKERLTSEQVISAYNRLKSGELYSGASDSFESDEGKDDSDESEDDSQIRKRKRSKGKVSVANSKVKSSRKEFVGWGSRPLLEFLASIGKDTTRELSDDAITTIISGYCKENKLFHPERKRKIICDARLKALFGRKSVNKNSIPKLLTIHLAENLDLLEEEFGSCSEIEVEEDLEACKRQSNSVKRSHTKEVVGDVQKNSHTKEVVMNVQESCFASVVPKNIKLVYLRKSLVEELSKQLETFEAKVMGSFVRVRSDPNDYLQKNSHQLVQVSGIHKTSVNAEILLELSDRVKWVPICNLSNDDFSEVEECEDLRQRVKNGLANRPTVVELRQKAVCLHEDITKHLQTPSEQSRLLNEIPEVIADIIELQPDCVDSTRIDEKENIGTSPESGHQRTYTSPAQNLKSNGVSCHLNDSTDTAAMVTEDKTQITAPSGQQYGVGTHNEAYGSGLSCVRAMKPSGNEAPNTAADLAADGMTEMNKRGEENSNDVAQRSGMAIEMHNSSSSEHDSHNPVLVDQTNEFELVVKDIQEVKKTMKEVLEGFKDLKEQMRLKLSS